MDRHLWSRLAQDVVIRLPATETWQITVEGLVRLPATWLARGIAWRPSAGKWLYAHAFVLPLYVPTQSLASNYAQELLDGNGRTGFDLEPEDIGPSAAELAAAMDGQARGFLDSVESIDGFGGMLDRRSRCQDEQGHHSRTMSEHLGYTWILAGQDIRAKQALQDAMQVERKAPAWQKQRAKRAAHVYKLLRQGANAALEQLEGWASESAAATGITRSAPIDLDR